MKKYSYEFKKKIVAEYLRGESGYQYLAKKYNITSKKQVRIWVNAYKEFGDEGLRRSRENKKYSFEFKLHVVELYLTTEVSCVTGMSPVTVSCWTSLPMYAPVVQNRKPVRKNMLTTFLSYPLYFSFSLKGHNFGAELKCVYSKQKRNSRYKNKSPHTGFLSCMRCAVMCDY